MDVAVLLIPGVSGTPGIPAGFLTFLAQWLNANLVVLLKLDLRHKAVVVSLCCGELHAR